MRTIRIKVITETKKEGVTKAKDGRLIVSVTEKKKEGRANQRACMLVSEYLGLPVKCVTIASGHTSPTKTLRVAG